MENDSCSVGLCQGDLVWIIDWSVFDSSTISKGERLTKTFLAINFGPINAMHTKVKHVPNLLLEYDKVSAIVETSLPKC